jgi:hypothetical protein
MTTRLRNYAEVRAYLEKGHPDWLRALTPRHVDAPADYWPQKVLAVSSVNAAMQNYVRIYEQQTQPNPALAVVQGQAAMLLRHDIPTYYVSKDLLAAALRTELPDDLVFKTIPFPIDALVFTLPKRALRHPGDCPFLVVSRPTKGPAAVAADSWAGFQLGGPRGRCDRNDLHAGGAGQHYLSQNCSADSWRKY